MLPVARTFQEVHAILENPYSAVQLEISAESALYRGEGRIEESPDGSSMTVWWESPLDESVAVQLHLPICWELGRSLAQRAER